MNIGPKGLALIKKCEGIELKAYRDSAGVLTIGYGHTSAAGAPAVRDGMAINQEEAEYILETDLRKYEAEVTLNVHVPLNQNQFDALVSWHYNTGAIAKATLTKKLNAGNYDAVPAEIAKWNKATVNGKKVVLRGLTTRRKMEADLWNTPPAEPAPASEEIARQIDPIEEPAFTASGPKDGSGWLILAACVGIPAVIIGAKVFGLF
jgi:lysozyme